MAKELEEMQVKTLEAYKRSVYLRTNFKQNKL